MLRKFVFKAFAAGVLCVAGVSFFGEVFAREASVSAPEKRVLSKIDTATTSGFAAALNACWCVPVEDFLAAWGVSWERSGSEASEKANTRGVASAYWSGRKLLGVGAEQVKVEFEKGVPVRVEVMFFNKGDTTSRAGMGFESNEQAERKKRFSEKEWKGCLTAVLAALEASGGERRRCSIGAGKLRRRAEAWKCADTVLVLDAQKNEFVRVVCVPVARFGELTASTAERVKSGGKLSGNLEKRDNGDVWIKNVPMVNQGDKGYCFPATVERVLRYYGIDDLDMHKIAELAGTGIGGGTVTVNAVKKLNPVIKKNRLEFFAQKMSFSKIRQAVDRGIPLVWSMSSTPAYRNRMAAQTRERLVAQDIASWAKRLHAMEELPFDPAEAREYGHVCLILGYNSKTKELCVSDSWGERTREQWVRFEDAECVTSSLYLLKN